MARASTWSGAPLTKQRTTSRPDSSCTRWKVAISLYSESNGSSARRGKLLSRLAPSRSRPSRRGRRARPPSGRRSSRRPSRRRRRRGSSASGTGRAAHRSCRPSAGSSPPSSSRSPRSCSGGPAIASSTAVIWFSVSVPVLSELIAEVAPSVSVERRRFTIAFAFASSCVPIERIVVTTAGRPVGIAAIANASAAVKTVLKRLAAGAG